MIEGSNVDVFISKYGRKKYREIRVFGISHFPVSWERNAGI